MTHSLEITGACFNEEFSCLGRQLEQILQSISRVQSSELTWYLFDVYGGTEMSLSELFPSESVGVIKITNTGELAERVKQVVQFESGVFIASEDNQLKVDHENEPHSEAEFGFQLQQSVIEIRAFDFRSFEIFMLDEEMYKHLSRAFSVH
ncbi:MULTISPECIES: hypothetical protein [Exiguobacterium]|uniref:hypothetical protein n=1 Tax=Exiguobacterium TaxID=33986 RepID=UPI001BE6A4DD|nr:MULTISPECIES: hypothetical protein [Exiguobacterium]MCT4775799.1 hypothetical protein [Exiguobacterium aquaticum]